MLCSDMRFVPNTLRILSLSVQSVGSVLLQVCRIAAGDQAAACW